MEKQITQDEDANLKRQARRRLIGAVALLTATVVLLPMVLDKEPAPVSQNIELRIPDKDKVAEFAPKMEQAASSVAAIASGVAAVSAVAISSVQAVSPASVQAVSQVLSSKPVAASKADSAKPEAKPAEKKSPENKPADKPVEKLHAANQHGFVVQVGAFANAEAVKHLVEKLAKQGLHPYTEKIGDKIRVRVGNYESHEAADKIKHKLEADGLPSNVVNLDQ